jgi:hypothetical protein
VKLPFLTNYRICIFLRLKSSNTIYIKTAMRVELLENAIAGTLDVVDVKPLEGNYEDVSIYGFNIVVTEKDN